MESFYGGRQGNPFIIVKRFDGIDIPVESKYRVAYYAYDIHNNWFMLDENHKLIEKTSENQFLYTSWKEVEKNGNGVRGPGGMSIAIPKEYAEGMVQCFAKGGSSTSEVNYGEYVLIDTRTGINEPNHIDNGKIFRRGMDYDNELGGAEYIGNILGPQGTSPELDMDSYSFIEDKLSELTQEGEPLYSGGTGAYTVTNYDLVPGIETYFDTQGNPYQSYNDEIKYGWVDVRDKRGNVETCLIGFRFPYLVMDFTAIATSPYETVDLIEEVTADKKHPFYKQWQLKIPKGIHGKDLSNLRVIADRAMPNAPYYSSPACTEDTKVGNLSDSLDLKLDAYRPESGYAMVSVNDGKYYLKIEDTWHTTLWYTETDYESREEGISKSIFLGPYNTIKKITSDESGAISVFYSYEEPDRTIGKLTYVLEAIVTKPNSGYSVEGNHLLILFSDYGGNITYYSNRFNKEIKGYIDLGYVKGDPGPGLHVIASYDSYNQLPSNPYSIPNYEVGDAVAVDKSIYIYDFSSSQWKYIGSVSDIKSTNIIRLEDINTSEIDELNEYGLWFITETIKFAE